MRRWIAAVCCLGLFAAGCGPQSPNSTKIGQEQGEKLPVNWDELLQISKMSMNTKVESDLPKTWNFEEEEARQKAAKLVPVLKQGQALSPEEKIDYRRQMPTVIFIFDIGGEKRVLNVFADSFEYQNQLYRLEQAPERTYGSVNKLRK